MAAGSEGTVDVSVGAEEEVDALAITWLFHGEARVRLPLPSPLSFDPRPFVQLRTLHSAGEDGDWDEGGLEFCRIYGSPHHPNTLTLPAPRPGTHRLSFANEYAWLCALRIRLLVTKTRKGTVWVPPFQSKAGKPL